MDRGDNLAGIGSLNGISANRQNPTSLAGRPISAADAAHAELFDFEEFLDPVFERLGDASQTLS